MSSLRSAPIRSTLHLLTFHVSFQRERGESCRIEVVERDKVVGGCDDGDCGVGDGGGGDGEGGGSGGGDDKCDVVRVGDCGVGGEDGSGGDGGDWLPI